MKQKNFTTEQLGGLREKNAVLQYVVIVGN